MKKALISLSVALGALAVILVGVYYLLPGAVLGVMVKAMRLNAGVELKTVTVEGMTWPYLEGGTGDTVLIIHGFGAEKDMWGELLPALTKKYRVIAPDLPGFGENSRNPSADYSIPAQAERVHAFAQKIGLKRFNLIGHSMGGAISAYYASLYPETVGGLVLMNSFGLRTPLVSDGEVLLKKGKRFLLYRNESQYDRTMGIVFLHPPALPSHFKRYLAAIGAKNFQVHSRIFDSLSREGFDFLRSRLPMIKARTLVLWGEKDRVFDVSCAAEYCKGIRSCRAVVVPESGHMVFMDTPAESIAAVTAFLGEVK
ncbi:MAG: alpha/beta hydrolase [Spirochaetes bacterium]|nr:alpha/beta hydrolase [Spirochaetota bacterium]